MTESSIEELAYKALLVTADYPATYGRIKTARIIIGLTASVDQEINWSPYIVEPRPEMTLKSTVELIDALIAGGLLTKVAYPRPTLVLTRTGHRALEGLEASSPATI